MPNLKVTQQDIADALNISRATVSKVFNNKPIPIRAKEIIIKKAIELGYIDSQSERARMMGGAGAAEGKNSEGIILFVYFPKKAPSGEGNAEAQRSHDMILGMEQACGAYNYSLIVSIQTDDSTGAIEFLQNYSKSRIDGIILCGDHAGTSGFLSGERKDMPIVLADIHDMQKCRFTHCDVIAFDHIAAMSTIIRHLRENGCVRIGYIGDRDNSSAGEHRISFMHGCIENEIEADKVLIKLHSCKSGAWASSLPASLPDAVICESDGIALALIKELESRGCSVPGKIYISGFDSSDDAEALENGLTTTFFSREDLGFKAVEQLIWRIRNPASPSVLVCLRPGVALRNSTSRQAV